MYKPSRQEFLHNNISYNNSNVFITILRHIESPEYSYSEQFIQAFSGIFTNI